MNLFYDDAFNALIENYNRKIFTDYEKWFNTRLGNKFTDMEIKATSMEAVLSMLVYQAEIVKKPPSKQRINLISKLDKVTGSAEHAYDFYITSYKVILENIENDIDQNDAYSYPIQVCKAGKKLEMAL